MSNALVPDGVWHEVARFTLRPGTWDVQYSSYTTSALPPYGDPSLAGGVQCKLTVGGETIVLADDSNGRYGQYLQEKKKNVAAGTTVTWTCKNTVTKNGAPTEIAMEFWQEETTPPTVLEGEAL